jgi:hypothetical protein
LKRIVESGSRKSIKKRWKKRLKDDATRGSWKNKRVKKTMRLSKQDKELRKQDLVVMITITERAGEPMMTLIMVASLVNPIWMMILKEIRKVVIC